MPSIRHKNFNPSGTFDKYLDNQPDEIKPILREHFNLPEPPTSEDATPSTQVMLVLTRYHMQAETIRTMDKKISSALSEFGISSMSNYFSCLITPSPDPDYAWVYEHLPPAQAVDIMGFCPDNHIRQKIETAIVALNEQRGREADNKEILRRFTNNRRKLKWSRVFSRHGSPQMESLSDSERRDICNTFLFMMNPPPVEFITDPSELVNWVEGTAGGSTCMNRKSDMARHWRDYFAKDGIHPTQLYLNNPYLAAVGIKDSKGKYKARTVIYRSESDGEWEYWGSVYCGTRVHRNALTDGLTKMGLIPGSTGSMYTFGNYRCKGIWSDARKDYVFPVPYVDFSVGESHEYLGFDVETKEFIVSDTKSSICHTRINYKAWAGGYFAKNCLTAMECCVCGHIGARSGSNPIITADGLHFCSTAHAANSGYVTVVNSIGERMRTRLDTVPEAVRNLDEGDDGFSVYYTNVVSATRNNALPLWKGSVDCDTYARIDFSDTFVVHMGKYYIVRNTMAQMLKHNSKRAKVNTGKNKAKITRLPKSAISKSLPEGSTLYSVDSLELTDLVQVPDNVPVIDW